MSPNTNAAVANALAKKPDDRDYLDRALVELWELLGDQKMRRIAAEETLRCSHLRHPELCDECLESPL